MKEPKSKHCLLIEDRADDALIVQKQLAGRPDLGLHWVKDGDEAVEYLKREGPFESMPRPDVILLDLRLPRMDGFQFLQWCQNNGPQGSTPVMILSCSTLPEDMVRAHDLGVGVYLTKPINWSRFNRELSTMLSQGAGLRANTPRATASTAQRMMCILTFPNGKKLAATAVSEFDGQLVRFDYGGDTSRLCPFAEKGTIGFLRWYMEGWAANLDAELEVIVSDATGNRTQ